MKNCFGYMSRIGPDTIPMFSVPWWFRTTFVGHLRRSQHAQLIINGVVGQADVWVNGRMVASQGTVQGDYTRYRFDITQLLHRGSNGLALELYPNDPNSMFTVDNIDWSQIPPDNNTGIQFPIQLHVSGPLALSNAHVVEHNAANLSSSALTVKGDITNVSSKRQTGRVSAVVSSPGGSATARLGRRITLAPGASRAVALPFRIHHPRVWWPYRMGGQPLYGLKLAVFQRRAANDSESETFGIRTITTRLVGPAPIAPHGSRQFLVNGKPFMFRGAAWSEDLLLRYSSADISTQIALIKNLGLNGIRTEGKQMPDDFYERMDRAGVLIDGGFQCCDAWQLPGNGQGVTSRDYFLLYLSARTIGENLRNHPSVMDFSWSDNNPTPQQEAVSLRGFRQADFPDPLIASAQYKSSVQLGPSGEKEGPYDWVPPSYWYNRTHWDHGDPRRTNVGGAWAFNSEASAGDTVPTMDSIRRFLSPFEQAELWQNPAYNQYHTDYEPQIGGYSFGTLYNLDHAISMRYGMWSDLAGYVEKAQVQNYETQRAQFEAYIDHSTDSTAPSTGLVYWMLNRGWPSLLWVLYNYDGDQPGSYFGAKEANKPLHALYTYDDGTVSIDNMSGARQGGISVRAKVYDLAGKILDSRSASGITLPDQRVATRILHPRVPADTAPPQPARMYFVELVLRQRRRVVDRNVYWLTTQPDVINWVATTGSPQATMDRFADLQSLQSLPPARLMVSARTRRQRGLNGSDMTTDVTIRNRSTSHAMAFFVRADVRRGSRSGSPSPGDNEVLPILWNDNDITLWPGESETLHASYLRSDLRGRSPVISVGGWNVRTINVPAR